jgi:ABC-2 type transport system ATP-binding protein
MIRKGSISHLGEGAIEARSLTKSFGERMAVRDLDLVVAPGELVGLLGPNGAGKTTTAGMFTTQVTPTSGHAAVAGVDVTADPSRVKSLIGVVPQDNTLDRSLTARDNLRFHGRYFGMSGDDAQREASRLLTRFGLADHAEDPVDRLSGGLAQRLMLARALMHQPQVLFLDEPTSGLDPQVRRVLWELVGELRASGQTILLTTHYMEEADALCDRVAIINAGQLLALDSPAALKAGAGHNTTITITAEGNLDALATALVQAIPEALDCFAGEHDVRLVVPDTRGHVAPIVQVADAAGFAVTDVAVDPTTLETVYIDLTGQELRP